MNNRSIIFLFMNLVLAGALVSCTGKSESTEGVSVDGDVGGNVGGDVELVGVGSVKGGKDVVAADEKISFNQHIQPILSANCYHCHGPDSGTRFPEDEPYRLDREEDALAVRANGKANIIKGDPDGSYLIQLMESKNPDEVMPLHPTRSPHGKVMDPADIALVRRWVKEGAVFEKHWAYIQPKKVELPEVEQTDWVRKPVDHFILAKLEEKGLKPNGDETRARLLRRLTFDLTGLPPSAAETEGFVNDKRDLDVVYEEKVNALLATEAYAEHFSRHWLDVARYGDTHGIHNDNYRSIWPYRDWVINAFRSNMRFDEFTKIQIAGDMMPDATVQHKVATGFHRCMPTTGEGGSIDDEVNASYAQERVNTTFATWLGITAGCAACHDHKFDAITTKENYEFSAFFRNTTMRAMDGNSATHAPIVRMPLAPEEVREIDTQMASNTKKKSELKVTDNESYINWLSAERERLAKVYETHYTKPSGLVVNLPLSKRPKGAGYHAFKAVKRLRWTRGKTGTAPYFKNGSYIDLGQAVDFNSESSFSVGAWFRTPSDTAVGSLISKMHTKEGNRGFDISTDSGKVTVQLVHSGSANALKVTSVSALAANTWNHVMLTYDGSSKARGLKLYFNGKQEDYSVMQDSLDGSIETSAPLLLGSRYQGGHFKDGKLQNFKVYDRVLLDGEVVTAAEAGDAEAEAYVRLGESKLVDQLREAYFDKIHPEAVKFNRLNAELATRRKGPTSLIMEEKRDTKPTARVLVRGDYSQPGEEVLSPGVPAAFPPMTDDMPRNRLGLAKWLVAENNPLPARVTVNRYWYYIFGSGIVDSNSDFGVMGSRPTHPGLLDWLAVDFVESGWDLHHLLKQMVMSSTYRQSATITEEKLREDPLNKYYARGPRYRLEAEQIRDMALKSSGLLNSKVGGPSVKPYMPDNVWEAVAMKSSNTRHYRRDSGDSLYRRSIYTFIKRTAVHPAMELLNAPTREESCVKRDLTNTPLQAFVIMNDPQFVESSRQLAVLALQNAESDKDRINYMSMRLISREMDERELGLVKGTLSKLMVRFKDKPEEAERFNKVGQSVAPSDIDPVELASWSIVANQLLNLDETLNK